MYNRCDWVPAAIPEYVAYHDQEWGVPLHDDVGFFELLCLEGAQAGLSWLTVLRKRAEYRKVFDGFIPQQVAAYGREKIEELMQNPGIIRNRRKIESAVGNARVFLELCTRWGSFDEYIWRYLDGVPLVNSWDTHTQLPSSTPLSDQISRDLKNEGFSFVGTTIIYALMQSAGLVNDHTLSCFRRSECMNTFGEAQK